MTARAEIARLLAGFKTLPESDKDIVLTVAGALKKPAAILVPSQARDGRWPGCTVLLDTV
jgi:hypothetical protein